jgi:hypothetical protein
MAYYEGQRVALWQTKIEVKKNTTQIVVLKEVIVTITEMKTGVPGKFSRERSSRQSLRGLGDDGKVYEKHWDSWPELSSGPSDFSSLWSSRDDGVGRNKVWSPAEAVHVYNNTISKRLGDNDFTLTDATGAAILPKGDVVYCEKHDDYSYGPECLWCLVAERNAQIGISSWH